MNEKERKKAQKKETRSQAWFALRAVLSAYLVYLGYDLIRNTVTTDEDLGAYYFVYILVGVVFAAVGIYVLINCWKIKKQRDREEREIQRAEAEAKGLLNFDDEDIPVAQATDVNTDGWGYRPEDNAQTNYIYEPEEKDN